jgi:hypothetical protein
VIERMTMENLINEKKSVTWLIEKQAIPKLEKMATEDKRTVGAEVAFLIDKEFEARFTALPNGQIKGELARVTE